MPEGDCRAAIVEAASGGFPAGRVSEFLSTASGLLAIAIGVYAFVPLIIEIAMQQSGDPDEAAAYAGRADRYFDLLLGSVVALGASVGLGLFVTYVHVQALYLLQVILLATGVIVLLIGTIGLGWTFRTIRRRA